MISFLILILFLVSRLNGKCTSTAFSSNSIQVATTNFHPVTTTIIQFDKCIKKKGSNEAGGKSKFLSESFNIDFSELKSLVVFSGQNIDSFKFNFIDGESSVYGNIKNTDITKVTKIDFFNKKVIAANIGWQINQDVTGYYYDSWVKSIQFLFYNLLTNKYEWTPKIGGELVSLKNSMGVEVGGRILSTSSEVTQPLATEFQVTSMQGIIDDYNTVMLAINYGYSICNPISPINSLLVSVSEIILPMITTSTVSFGTCETKSDLTKIFGAANIAIYSSRFTVNLPDLESFTIFSDTNIKGIKFNFLNGTSDMFGYIFSDPLVSNNTIDVKNKKIIGVIIRSSNVISSLQFLIYDSILKTSSWTSVFGSSYGEIFSFNGSSIEVTKLSGTTDYEYLRTLSVGYTYKLCNPIN